MTYQDTLDYLFSQLPMYQRIGQAAYKANLDNTWWLMNMLGNPQDGLKCIHVAGTNGKGSTSHLLASIFQEAGYKTGLYTSPHLVDFRERIKINGAMISKDYVVDFTEKYRTQFSNQGLSFFEWTVGLAFDYFRSEKVDVAIIEVGMGGRLDSTNVVTPELSIITNIGFDHVQFLGNTLEKIATEKGGIIKPNIPVVIGKTQLETKPVFQQIASEKKAPIYFADEKEYVIFECPLKGDYQINNFKTVLKAIDLLKETWKIDHESISAGFKNVLQNTHFRGRWDILQTNPTIICDVGHNIDGILHNLKQLEHMRNEGKLHFVLGFVNDKSLDQIIPLFPKDACYYFTKASVPRSLGTNELAAQFKRHGFQGLTFEHLEAAYRAALVSMQSEDILYIGGSTFIVADLYLTLQ